MNSRGISYNMLLPFFLFRRKHSSLQWTSDADCLELGLIPQAKSTVFYRTTLPADISHKLGGSWATWTSDQLNTNSGVPITLSGSTICYSESQNAGQHCTCNNSAVKQTDTNQNQPDERPSEQGLGRSRTQSFCVLGQHHPPSPLPCVTNWGTPLELWVAKFLLGFQYIDMIDRLTGHRTELSLYFLLPHKVRLMSCGSKAQPPKHEAGLASMASLHPEPSQPHSHISLAGTVWRDHPWLSEGWKMHL